MKSPVYYGIFFSRYLYSYICLIMRCSLLKYDVLIIFLAFPFVLNPALTESFRWCVSTYSHPDCRISVQVCPWFNCWRLVTDEQKSIHVFLMFSSFLLPFFPFHLSFKCGRLLSLSLGAVSRGWGNSKTEGEGVIWSARPLEVTIGNGNHW